MALLAKSLGHLTKKVKEGLQEGLQIVESTVLGESGVERDEIGRPGAEAEETIRNLVNANAHGSYFAETPIIVSYEVQNGDDEDSEVAVFPLETPANGVTVGYLRSRFPVQGKFHFRFKIPPVDGGFPGWTWADFCDDDEPVPVRRCGICVKALRIPDDADAAPPPRPIPGGGILRAVAMNVSSAMSSPCATPPRDSPIGTPPKQGMRTDRLNPPFFGRNPPSRSPEANSLNPSRSPSPAASPAASPPAHSPSPPSSACDTTRSYMSGSPAAPVSSVSPNAPGRPAAPAAPVRPAPVLSITPPHPIPSSHLDDLMPMDNFGSNFGGESTRGLPDAVVEAAQKSASSAPTSPQPPLDRAKLQRERIEGVKQQVAAASARQQQNVAQEAQIKADKVEFNNKLGVELDRWAKTPDGQAYKDVKVLISTMHTVLWPGVSWNECPLANLVSGGSAVKKEYRKAILVVHPDKQKDAPIEQQVRADRIFQALNESFKTCDP